MLCGMESMLFEDVGDALRGILPPDLGTLHVRAHRYGIKVWFGTEKPTRARSRSRSDSIPSIRRLPRTKR